MGHAGLRATLSKLRRVTTLMAIPQQQNPLFQEGRLILALNTHKQSQFLSFRSAVKTYDVPWTTA